MKNFAFKLKFSNDRNYCNVCDTYSEFVNSGDPPRLKVRCKNCNSLERHRQQWEYIKSETNLFSAQKFKLLHVAPERTYYDRLVDTGIDYTGIDLFPADRGVEDFVDKGNVQDMKYPDNYFDGVICNHVLEHVDDDVQAMKELHRVMKKDAFGLIDIPIEYDREETFEDPSVTDPEERKKVFGQHDHVRIYGTDFFERMASVGFEVEKIDYMKRLGKKRFREMGLMDKPLLVTKIKAT